MAVPHAVPRAAMLAPTLDAALDSVADAIHDGLVQDLVAARYLLDLLADQDTDGQLEDLGVAIRGALANARVLMDRARSKVRDGHGLQPAIRALAETSHAPADLSVDLPEQIDPGVAVTVYRLTQAVMQAADLGGADHISLRADARDGVVRVTAVITGGCDLSWVPSWEHHLRSTGGSMDIDNLPGGVRIGSTIVTERRRR